MSVGLWSVLWTTALAVLAYTYVGYPTLVVLWARLRKRTVREGEFHPSISIVLAARNEQDNIVAKIHNLMALSYPPALVDLVIVDDGSTDATVAEAQRAAADYPARSIRVISLPEARGKTVALHQGVLQSDSEMIAFCDARQEVDPEALTALARVFVDPLVGAASAELHLAGERGPGLYWRYERLIRSAESRIDSMVGVTGALYMIRRDLYQEFPPHLILDDVWMPMQIAMKGYRVVLVPDAKIYDEEAQIEREFQRKTRTLAGNFELMAKMPALLLPWRNRLFWAFVSHKGMRLLCPYALLVLLVASGALTLTTSWRTPGFWLWSASTIGQVGFYVLAILHLLRPDQMGRLARIAGTFVALNWAAVVGFFRFLTNDMRWTR